MRSRVGKLPTTELNWSNIEPPIRKDWILSNSVVQPNFLPKTIITSVLLFQYKFASNSANLIML